MKSLKKDKKIIKKDWMGNKATAFAQIGTIFQTKQTNPNRGLDFYASPPRALEDLLKHEKFENVWECADGVGHLCGVLKNHGILAKHSDIVYRGCGEVIDFLKYEGVWNGDIITNPPYKWALEFVLKSLKIIPESRKVAMLLKIQFLEGKRRKKELFDLYPPKVIYVWPDRITCALNGDFDNIKHGSPMMFAWFVWQKGWYGGPIVRWF